MESSLTWTYFLVLLFTFPACKSSTVYYFGAQKMKHLHVDPDSNQSTSLHDRGVNLIIQREETMVKAHKKITICLRTFLMSQLPQCLFDVAGIQFFYSRPQEPRYGHLRIKLGTEAERTVLFVPPDAFKVRQLMQICLAIKLEEDKSHIQMLWDGKQILDEVYLGKDSIRGAFWLNETNTLGVCHLTDQNIGTDPSDMQGGISDFYGWDNILDFEDLEGYTKCRSFPAISPIIQTNNNSEIGHLVHTYPQNVCGDFGKDEPMITRVKDTYLLHENQCKFFGGKIYHLTSSKQDFEDKTRTAIYFSHVVGNQNCTKFWIPIQKDFHHSGCNWTITGAGNCFSGSLSFAPGEPNGGSHQQCAVAELLENEILYHDEDCSRKIACAMCMIPPIQMVTLRGLTKTINLDTWYYVNPFIHNPTLYEVQFPGVTRYWALFHHRLNLLEIKKDSKTLVRATTAYPYGMITNVSTFQASANRWENGRTIKFTNVPNLQLKSITIFKGMVNKGQCSNSGPIKGHHGALSHLGSP